MPKHLADGNAASRQIAQTRNIMSTTTEMEQHTINRSGLPPIRFTGTLIGIGSNRITSNGHANRWTTIRIYRSRGGRYIGEINRMTCWQGERDSFAGTSRETAQGLIDWLREQNGGEIGWVSEEAIEDAVKKDAGFAAAWLEEVE